MSQSDMSLEDLRARIDRVDDALHDLLMARAELVDQIRANKPLSKPVFRPNREAAILRRLLARHKGALPRQALVRLWREMISAFAWMQRPFTLVVGDQDANSALLWSARDHFGVIPDYVLRTSAAGAISHLLEGKADLAVLPFPDTERDQEWCRILLSRDGEDLKITTALPMVPFHDQLSWPQALVVAKQELDYQQSDRMLLAMEIKHAISRSRMNDILQKSGLALGRLWGGNLNQQGDSAKTARSPDKIPPFYLVELTQPIAPDGREIADIKGHFGPDMTAIGVIGAYIPPIDLTDGKNKS